MVERVTSAADLPIVVLGGEGAARADVHADPTGGFGVGVSKARLTGPSFSSIRPDDRHVVSVQLSGRVGVDVRLGDRRLTHEPRRGSIGIAPAGADGAAETSGPMEAIFLRVSAECLAMVSAQQGQHGGVLVERMQGRDPLLAALACALEAEARSLLPNGPLYWTSLTDALLRRLAFGHVSIPTRLADGALDARSLARLDDHVRSNLSSPLDIQSLATAARCDSFRFARAFRAATGVNPHRYVTRLRLEHARALVRNESLSLAEIAVEAGFCDQSHMSRWFRRVYGVAPGKLARLPAR